ncbi:MAG: sodium-dependent transporter [Gammaproteobacteria bacterium]
MRKRWSSKWTFILATTGAAVGLGNIWKFPYIAGVNGGGAFVLIYLICVLAIGIPLLVAELILGRSGRQNPISTIQSIAQSTGHSRKWGLIGGLCILTGFIILSYYSMIAGWAFDYVVQSVRGSFHQLNAEQANEHFNTLISDPLRLIFWHTLIMASTVFIVASGVRRGLERYILYLFPAMIFILLLLVIYALVATDFFIESLIFLFQPDFSEVNSNTVLVALGQAFFTLSLALGTIIAYGAYLPRDVSIPEGAFTVAFADTTVALLAGMAIFPIVFAHDLTPSAGPGLLFQSLPIAFGDMPYGNIFSALFFFMIVLAALATTISLLEPTVSWLIEKFKLTRRHAAVVAGSAVWLLGFLSIFSFNLWSGYQLFGLSIFGVIDYITSNIMLPLGGLLIAVFVGWFMKKQFIQRELNSEKGLSYYLLRFLLAFICPIAIIAVFLNAVGII